MKALAALTASLILTACGIDTSKLNAQPPAADSTMKDQGQATGQASDAPAADQSQPQTTVKVHTETDVEITTGGSSTASNGKLAQDDGSIRAGQLLRFADGAFGWFFADGSFDRGAALAHGQEAPAYCRFEAPDCEGRCIIDSLPAKDSLFTNGAAFFRAYETETDLGRTVVASIWMGGACQAQVKTLAHAYSPNHSWVLDAGDSTIPSQHDAQ